jgi:hypothetical protein
LAVTPITESRVETTNDVGVKNRLPFLAIIMLLTAEVVFPQTSWADSIRLVRVTPKRGTHLVVGEHVVISITVKYKLAAADKAEVALVIQKEDNSSLTAARHQRIWTEVARGSGEATLSYEFDVPTGTSVIRLLVPLMPEGRPRSSGVVVVEYPVKGRKPRSVLP